MENQNQQNQNNLDEVQNETAFQPLSEGEQAQVTGGHWNLANMANITVDTNETVKPHNDCPPGHAWHNGLNVCVPHESNNSDTHSVVVEGGTR